MDFILCRCISVAGLHLQADNQRCSPNNFTADKVLSPAPILQVDGRQGPRTLPPIFCRADATSNPIFRFPGGGEGVGCVNLFILLPLSTRHKKNATSQGRVRSHFILIALRKSVAKIQTKLSLLFDAANLDKF